MSLPEGELWNLLSKIKLVRIDGNRNALSGWTALATPTKVTLRNYCAGLKLEIDRSTIFEYDIEDVVSAVKVTLLNSAFVDAQSARI